MWINLKPKEMHLFEGEEREKKRRDDFITLFSAKYFEYLPSARYIIVPSNATWHARIKGQVRPCRLQNIRQLRRTASCLLRFYKEQDIKWDTSSLSFKTCILPSAVHCSLLPWDTVCRCSSAFSSAVVFITLLSAELTLMANESRALTPAWIF